MYINCVYCGHRYGPKDKVPATMADALKQHIEQCPSHPMSVLKKQNAEMRELIERVPLRMTVGERGKLKEDASKLLSSLKP
jgi:hypothetical protein